jgi:protein-tyrosine phosphatase
MFQIRPWLYVGRYAETINPTLLHEKRIGAMLQLHEPASQPDITSLFVAMRDGEPLPTLLFEKAVTFVRAQKAEGKTVLVACSAGISRSVALATASLKLEEQLTLHDAFHAVRAAHPRALPDQVHWEMLCRYFNEDISFWDIWRETVDV